MEQARWAVPREHPRASGVQTARRREMSILSTKAGRSVQVGSLVHHAWQVSLSKSVRSSIMRVPQKGYLPGARMPGEAQLGAGCEGGLCSRENDRLTLGQISAL